MNVIFLGGTETVTGSKFLIETKNTKVLVDCGLYQGYKWLRQRNWQPLPFDISQLDAVLLSHAHLDHSGYIPVLYKQAYRGPVYTHPATKDLCEILLVDSGHIQEEDAKFYAKHHLSKHEPPLPLYDQEMGARCIELFETVPFGKQFSIGDIKVRFQSAGHILGAASIIVEAEGKRIIFSGDVGRPNDIFMKPPELLPDADLLILESTYGDRRHDQTDPCQQLAEVVLDSAEKGGVLLIPSFAVGRAQVLLHMLVELVELQRIPKIPIFLDSPMAINVSDIYCRYSNEHRLNQTQCDKLYNIATFTRSVADSKLLSGLRFPHIIIAGSGMATGGRILHHMKRLLSDHRTTVLFTGFQAGGTRGAKMLQGAETVRIHGQWIANRAQVRNIHGLSGHGDYVEIGDWLRKSNLKKGTKIKLVHGSLDALEGMRDYLNRSNGYDVEVADYRSILRI